MNSNIAVDNRRLHYEKSATIFNLIFVTNLISFFTWFSFNNDTELSTFLFLFPFLITIISSRQICTLCTVNMRYAYYRLSKMYAILIHIARCESETLLAESRRSNQNAKVKDAKAGLCM